MYNRAGSSAKPFASRFDPPSRGSPQQSNRVINTSPPPSNRSTGGFASFSRQKTPPPSPRDSRPGAAARAAVAPLILPRNGKTQPQNVDEEISRQVAEWDAQMDGIDKQQESLLNEQWKLLRSQIGSLMGALADMRNELGVVKEATSKEHLEQAIEQIMSHIDSHGEAHSSVIERVKYLEDFIGESADKHKTMLGDHEDHKTTMETRLEYIEGLIGDSADKHSSELNSAMDKMKDLHKAIESCAKHDHASGLDKRIDYLEKFLGEGADNHDNLKTTMEERMEYLEKLLGDSAENHAQELKEAQNKLKDMHAAIGSCAQAQHHSSLEKRMDYIEKLLGESADKHDNHKTTIEERMEFLEDKMGDSAEKHWKEIEAAHKKLGDIHKAVNASAKQDHASSLEKRLDFIEKSLGDDVDKHAQALKNHTAGFTEHKENMETRLEFLEKLLGDSADKHWKEIDASKKKLGSLEAAVAKCAKSDHHSSLEERVEFLEKELGESADKHHDHKNSIEGRVEGIEREMKALGLSLDGKGHKSEIEKLEQTVLAGIDKRLTTIEEKHLQDFIKRLGDYEKTHMSEFDAMKARLGDVDKALQECAKIEHYLGLDRKHGALSDQFARDVELTKGKFGELMAKVNANEASIDSIGRKVTDGQDAMMRKLSGLEATNARFKTLLDDFDNNLRGERSNRETGDGRSEERLAKLESFFGGSFGNWAKDLESAQAKMRDMTGKLDAQKLNIDNFRMVVDQRLKEMETQLTEIPGADLLKEMDQRFMYAHDDQKRSRDMLESSLSEQIRLEHSAVHNQASQIKEQWDREVKARQAYQDNYKDLLGQERSAREAQEAHFDRRLENFERSIYAEMQRVWSEIQNEKPPIVVHQQAQPPPTYVVQSPRVSQVRVSPPQSTRYLAGSTPGVPFGTTSFELHTGTSSVAPSYAASPPVPLAGTFAYDVLSGSTGHLATGVSRQASQYGL